MHPMIDRAPEVAHPMVEFAKKVGIICGAALATISFVNLLGGFAISQVVKPAVQEMIAEERMARISADSSLAASLSSLSQDRVDILSILSRNGVARARAMERARARWNLDQ